MCECVGGCLCVVVLQRAFTSRKRAQSVFLGVYRLHSFHISPDLASSLSCCPIRSPGSLHTRGSKVMIHLLPAYLFLLCDRGPELAVSNSHHSLLSPFYQRKEMNQNYREAEEPTRNVTKIFFFPVFVWAWPACCAGSRPVSLKCFVITLWLLLSTDGFFKAPVWVLKQQKKRRRRRRRKKKKSWVRLGLSVFGSDCGLKTVHASAPSFSRLSLSAPSLSLWVAPCVSLPHSPLSVSRARALFWLTGPQSESPRIAAPHPRPEWKLAQSQSERGLEKWRRWRGGLEDGGGGGDEEGGVYGKRRLCVRTFGPCVCVCVAGYTLSSLPPPPPPPLDHFGFVRFTSADSSASFASSPFNHSFKFRKKKKKKKI